VKKASERWPIQRPSTKAKENLNENKTLGKNQKEKKSCPARQKRIRPKSRWSARITRGTQNTVKGKAPRGNSGSATPSRRQRPIAKRPVRGKKFPLTLMWKRKKGQQGEGRKQDMQSCQVRKGVCACRTIHHGWGRETAITERQKAEKQQTKKEKMVVKKWTVMEGKEVGNEGPGDNSACEGRGFPLEWVPEDSKREGERTEKKEKKMESSLHELSEKSLEYLRGGEKTIAHPEPKKGEKKITDRREGEKKVRQRGKFTKKVHGKEGIEGPREGGDSTGGQSGRSISSS